MAALQQATPPAWLGRSAWSLLLDVLGGPALWVGRGWQVGGLVWGYLSPMQVREKVRRLIALGFADAAPTVSQILVAGYHQMFLGAVEETRLFYKSQGIPWVWHNLRRFISGPATLLDPVGLFSPAQAIITHLLQTFHRHPIYDMMLLSTTEGALDDLESQAAQILAGTHPEQRALCSLIEDGGYHARLPTEIAAFRADPHAPARPVPDGLVPDAMLMLAMDQFKDLRGFFRYAARLTVGPVDVARAALLLAWNQTLGAVPALHLGPTRIEASACDLDIRARHLPSPR